MTDTLEYGIIWSCVLDLFFDVIAFAYNQPECVLGARRRLLIEQFSTQKTALIHGNQFSNILN